MFTQYVRLYDIFTLVVCIRNLTRSLRSISDTSPTRAKILSLFEPILAQIILTKHRRFPTRSVKSLSILWVVKFAKGRERARAWANVAMASCVADPHRSEAKCATNKRRESNWYLSKIGRLRTWRAATKSKYPKEYSTVDKVGSENPLASKSRFV